MAAKEQLVEIDSCVVRIARGGEGPPLLFLHGANGPNLWSPFFEALAQRFTVLAPDHPSFGASADADWLHDIGDLAYFYLDFLKHMDLTGVHLVGHSMGGWLAAEIAVRSTQRLASVTLMSAAGLRVPGHNGVDIFMTKPADLVAKHLYVDEVLTKQALAELEAPKSDEELDTLIRNRTSAARLCWHPRLNNPQLARWLHRIDVPVHLVWGDSDHIVPPAHADAYKKLIPEAELSLIEKAGHVPQVERARETLDAVVNFLGERVS